MYKHRIYFFPLRRFSSNPNVCYKEQAKPVENYYGLNKIERKHYKRRVEKVFTELKDKHIYKESFKIESKYELADLLIESEIYNNGGLIGLVKPFGVRRYKEEGGENRSITCTLNSPGHTSSVSIEEALPLLKKHYGNSHYLHVLFTPERYLSGILLLSSKETMTRRVEKCFKRSLGLQTPNQIYCALVHGLPNPETASERVGMCQKSVVNIGKVPVIKKTFSKNSVSNQEVKPNIVEHNVLYHHPENDVSLAEVRVIHNSSHFVRVWLADCFSPVLGDRMFGGRVKTVMRKRVQISLDSYSSYQPSNIEPNLLEKLDLSIVQAEIIPTHLYLSGLKLRKWNKDEDLILTAPPPEYFTWTCKKLDLMSKLEDEHQAFEFVGSEDDTVVEDTL